MNWESVIAFAPRHNSPGLHDATGAFIPEARRFLQLAGGEGRKGLFLFNPRRPMAERAAYVLDTLREYEAQKRKVRAVAFFCHGYSRGLQAGFRSSGRSVNVSELAEAIADISGAGVIVPLYACSTAGSPRLGAPGGDGGFADSLRDALCRHGATHCRVDAHVTLGHTTRNPHVRRFEGAGSPIGGVGGAYLVPPSSPYWQGWKRALRKTDSRLLFPWWDSARVVAEAAGDGSTLYA